MKYAHLKVTIAVAAAIMIGAIMAPAVIAQSRLLIESHGWIEADRVDVRGPLVLCPTEAAANTGLLAGGTIAPDYSVIGLSTTAALSTSAVTAISNGNRSGQVLTLFNVGANTATIKNSANTVMGADVALDSADALTLIYISGTGWVASGLRDNSP